MKLSLYGISHHTCSVCHREKLNLSQDEQYAILRQMHSAGDIAEGLVLNTCNRLEFYIYASKKFDAQAFVEGIINTRRPDALETWKAQHYQHNGIDVISHIFRVAAGLDSQMIGENQILAQLKSAYAASLQCGTSKFIFHKMLHGAFHVGKEVRSEGILSGCNVSVSLAAAEMARKEFKFPDCTAMVIGAGENSELAARHLVEGGIKGLVIANRSIESAKALAKNLKLGRAIALEDIKSNLEHVDFVITSTGSVEPILKASDINGSIGLRPRPLLIIDIAVPRDVEPEVGGVKGVKLLNIDDLNKINSENSRLCEQVSLAMNVVDEHVKKFDDWLSSLSIVPVITELTQNMVSMAKSEARRYAGDFSGIEAEKLEAFAESLARKFLHGPITFLKNGDDEPNFEQMQAVNLLNKMFSNSQGNKGQ
jgi:glutamyl-tRNA reductase